MGEQNNSRKQLRPIFEKLWIWQEAHRLMLEMHGITKTLPEHEKYRKQAQIERASSSVPDNVAEGYTSYYYNDKLKGMYVARKEAGETQNHLKSLQDKSYISKSKANLLISDYEYLIRGLNSFINYVVRKRSATRK